MSAPSEARPWVGLKRLAPPLHLQLYGIHDDMNAVLDPIISEFETENQAASYNLWFRGQVQQALDSKAPRIPHDQVMAEMEAIIARNW